VNGSPLPRAVRSAAAAGSVSTVGRAAAAASAALPIRTERRLSWVLAMSAKLGSVLSFGGAYAQALPHFRWQVTALRFP
jgi:hypothetical protein